MAEAPRRTRGEDPAAATVRFGRAARAYAPVAILGGLSLLFAAGVADLAWGIAFGLPVRLSDAVFAGAMLASRTQPLTGLLAVYTHAGDVGVASAIVLACAAALWVMGRKSSALFLVGVTASAALVNTGLKEVVDRTRPPAMLAAVPLPHSASFPSGHAVIGLTLGVALAIVLMKEAGFARGIVPGIVAVALGALIGVSRIYLGVHWWSDVLGGWMFALAWLSAWSAGWLWLLVRNDRRHARGAPRPRQAR